MSNLKEIMNDNDEIGDEHISHSADTPMRTDAFVMNDDVKIDLIEKHFREIMIILGMDLSDDSLHGTPRRVARMYVKEIFRGLNPKNKPETRLFENKYNYGQMLVEKNITFYSNCEHHFVPIWGLVHVAYIANGHVIGLSKINRIIQYVAARPQVQERMTMQILVELRLALKTEDIAVVVDAHHHCVSSRGIKDIQSSTTTSEFSGKFQDNEKFRTEFFTYIAKK